MITQLLNFANRQRHQRRVCQGIAANVKQTKNRRGRHYSTVDIFKCSYIQYLVIGSILILVVFYTSFLVQFLRRRKWHRDSIIGEGGRGGLGKTSSSSNRYHMRNDGNLLYQVNNNQTKRTITTTPSLQKLRYPIDYEQYTIRINTWRRNEQLLLSLDHHSTCDGVAQIQVIWCDVDKKESDGIIPVPRIPNEILNHVSGKVIVERHYINSLNERFHILTESIPPTLGILSMDDDVLRPCQAIDSGFFQWTRSPERIVGFDARTHLVNETTGEWMYGPLSATQRTRKYSLTLPRYCFLHRDYLDVYMHTLPPIIHNRITDKLNCEDIAMSLLVSSLTDGQPPLLANRWAMSTQIKLYQSNSISNNSAVHNAIRHGCVNDFATMLGLKRASKMRKMPGIDGVRDTGQHHELRHTNVPMYDLKSFSTDANVDDTIPVVTTRREESLRKLWSESLDRYELIGRWMTETGRKAKAQGLISNTAEWEARWKFTASGNTG